MATCQEKSVNILLFEVPVTSSTVIQTALVFIPERHVSSVLYSRHSVLQTLHCLLLLTFVPMKLFVVTARSLCLPPYLTVPKLTPLKIALSVS